MQAVSQPRLITATGFLSTQLMDLLEMQDIPNLSCRLVLQSLLMCRHFQGLAFPKASAVSSAELMGIILYMFHIAFSCNCAVMQAVSGSEITKVKAAPSAEPVTTQNAAAEGAALAPALAGALSVSPRHGHLAALPTTSKQAAAPVATEVPSSSSAIGLATHATPGAATAAQAIAAGPTGGVASAASAAAGSKMPAASEQAKGADLASTDSMAASADTSSAVIPLAGSDALAAPGSGTAPQHAAAGGTGSAAAAAAASATLQPDEARFELHQLVDVWQKGLGVWWPAKVCCCLDSSMLLLGSNTSGALCTNIVQVELTVTCQGLKDCWQQWSLTPCTSC